MSGVVTQFNSSVRVAFIAASVVVFVPVGATHAPPLPASTTSLAWCHKVDPRVLQSAATNQTEFLVILNEQANVRGAAKLRQKNEKGAHVHQRLTAVAYRTQAPILKLLKARRLEHRAFWIINMIWVRGTLADVQWLSQRADIARVLPNASRQLQEPIRTTTPAAANAPAGVEWNIAHVHAPDLWALGYTGQGVVVGGQDTGYQWDHPALKSHYRGWDGATVDHNYNWHDAIHAIDSHNSGDNPCGLDLTAPCDDQGHGTHTMGTMVGDDDAGNQNGMAPGAKWIGCRNMERGWGTPASYAECFEWFLAPTDLTGQNTNTALAPDVINNSWYCPDQEGCFDPLIYTNVIQRLHDAGIVVIVSAGNNGSGCSTITMPALYASSFAVGATDSGDNIAGFSSRGPVTVDGSNRLKPDISAPGVSIRSSFTNSTYAGGWSGTSMAGPHVAGLVALLISAHPELRGQVDKIEELIKQTAVRLTTAQNCGSVPGTQIPNNTYGWGRIDAFAALGLQDSDGDGLTDYQEILAGTDPHNATNVLRITAVQPQPPDNLITFITVTNHHYDLEYTGTLTSTNWLPVTNNLTGTGDILQVTDPGGAALPQRFYRIKLAP